MNGKRRMKEIFEREAGGGNGGLGGLGVLFSFFEIVK